MSSKYQHRGVLRQETRDAGAVQVSSDNGHGYDYACNRINAEPTAVELCQIDFTTNQTISITNLESAMRRSPLGGPRY